MKRKKRPDSIDEKQRIFQPKASPVYKSVKTRLIKVLVNPDHNATINLLVAKINNLVIHSYSFIRLYLLHCYKQTGHIPEVNETLVNYAIKTLGTRDKRGRQSVNRELYDKLEQFYRQEYQPLVNHTKTCLKNNTFILPYIVTQIITAITNNTQERFVQHFFRFINQTTTDITTDRKELGRFKQQLLRKETVDPKFSQWCNQHQEKIIPSEIVKTVNYSLKANPLSFLQGMIYMSDALEQQGRKLFQSVPLRTDIIPHHITLDTASIINIFPIQSGVKGQLLKAVRQNKGTIWKEFLRLDQRVFRQKGYEFNGQIQTDGVSVSLSFIRKDHVNKRYGQRVEYCEHKCDDFPYLEELDKSQVEALKTHPMIGCDPGKRNLVFLIDENGQKLRYTAPQRRKESHVKRSQRTLQYVKKKEGIIEKETVLSEYNSKSVNYDKFKMYLKAKILLNSETEYFYSKEIWRKERFRQWSYGQSSVDRFLNRIADTYGEDTVIAYGNWSSKSQMKGCVSSLGIGLRRLIHRRFDTVTVNESYTSQKCCGCHTNLEHAKNIEGKPIYRLLRCLKCVSFNNQPIVFRNRDANSATNILNLAKCYLSDSTRPESFCRPKNNVDNIDSQPLTKKSDRVKPFRLSLVPRVTGERETIRIDFTGVRSPTFSKIKC